MSTPSNRVLNASGSSGKERLRMEVLASEDAKVGCFNG